MTLTFFETRSIAIVLGLTLLLSAPAGSTAAIAEESAPDNQVLEWNQIFIDTLIATNTPNSSSQRLGAIVHTAIFDAYNGIHRRYTPVFVHSSGPQAASRRAAVIAAAHTALVGLFPSRQASLDASYAASLAALTERCHDGPPGQRRGSCERKIAQGLEWGIEVAHAVLAWRVADGFSASYPAFTGGVGVGQWRPTPPAFGPMSAQGLAFSAMFVLVSNTQFQPPPPRTLTSMKYADDFNAVKALGRRTGSTRTGDQTALAPFWEGNASVHWNQAANQIARASHLSIAKSNRLLAVLNIAMADPDWLPLVNTPSHPEYLAGHPSLNGAAATVLLSHFNDEQTFTLTTPGQPERTYRSIGQAREDGNNARVWGGMHYPSTVIISDTVGETIARYVNRHAMQLPRAH